MKVCQRIDGSDMNDTTSELSINHTSHQKMCILCRTTHITFIFQRIIQPNDTQKAEKTIDLCNFMPMLTFIGSQKNVLKIVISPIARIRFFLFASHAA